jgi:hypothetical protein
LGGQPDLKDDYLWSHEAAGVESGARTARLAWLLSAIAQASLRRAVADHTSPTFGHDPRHRDPGEGETGDRPRQRADSYVFSYGFILPGLFVENQGRFLRRYCPLAAKFARGHWLEKIEREAAAQKRFE